MEYILIVIALLPVFIIATYVNKKDKNKEPAKLLAQLFILGIVSCFLTVYVSELLGKFIPFVDIDVTKANFIEVLLHAFIGIALIEEGSKLFMVYNMAYKNKEFDELYDIIVYSVFVALGFAAFENVLYIFGVNDFAYGAKVGVLRGLLAVPGHACDGLFMGYYLSLAKIAELQNQKQLAKRNFIKSLLIPTVLHGTYDFCCFSSQPVFILVFFIFIIFMYIISIKKLKFIATNNRPLVITNNYCGTCGSPVTGIFCGHCGRRVK